MPLDIMALASEVNLPDAAPPPEPPAPDPELIDKAAALLAAAKQPLIYVGSGAAAAGDELLALAERLQAPVTTYTGGKGIVSDRHYLAQNLLAGHELWPKVDVVLAVGSRFNQPQTRWGLDGDVKVIRIDLDPVEITRIAKPAIGIVADAKAALAALYRTLERKGAAAGSRRDELEALKRKTQATLEDRLGPQCEYVAGIRGELPDDGIYVEDLTQVGYVGRLAFPAYTPRTYINSGYQGTLGFSYATALGAKVACPDRAVVSVRRRRLHVQRAGDLDRGEARHRRRRDRLCRRRLRQCAAHAEAGLRQPADRGRSAEPELPEDGRELWYRRGAGDQPRRVAPRTQCGPETARTQPDRGAGRRDAGPVADPDHAAGTRPALINRGMR
jgi:hypothetical protein